MVYARVLTRLKITFGEMRASGVRGLLVYCSALWACGQRPCVVQAQRHVHSATGSGLPTGLTGSAQALAVEIDAVSVMDQAIEDGVGVGGIAD